MVLEEFDSNKKAVINPPALIAPVEGMPKVAVTCFSRITFARLLNELGGVEIAQYKSANMVLPVYKTTYKGLDVALFMSYVGAPSCIATIEEIIAMGAEKFIIFGSCGVLDASIEDCSVIIPDSAVRDEGTSYHYAPASDEIAVNPKYIEEFTEILDKLNCKYTIGKTWTTDGVYRETRGKVEKRKASGCICVDMECSAAAALASFRGVDIFQFFYAADNLDNEVWDKRSLSSKDKLPEKDKIAILAMELAVRIGK